MYAKYGGAGAAESTRYLKIVCYVKPALQQILHRAHSCIFHRSSVRLIV